MTAVRAGAQGLELARHARRAARTLLYLVLGLGHGLVALVLVGGALLVRTHLRIGRAGRGIGRAAAGPAWRVAERERRQANRLLGTHLAPLVRAPAGTRALEATARVPFWRVATMLVLRFPVALLGLAVAAAPLALAAVLLALAVEGLGGGPERLLGPAALGPALGIALCLLAVAAGVVFLAVLDGVGRLVRALAMTLLRSQAPEVGPVREMLAERLGDRTLSIAYWLEERGIFVDERGHQVELPDPRSRRAWTAVEHDGRRVAAIIHDAELDATPELVHAAAAGAALAIDNEHLKADLRARVEELRLSRRRIVEAADEARRRLERDLHDGAQQRLVSLALDIRTLRARVRDPVAAGALDELGTKLSEALSELRELARGIHPAVLTDRGLALAVAALAARATVPVDARVEVDGRLAPAVEAAAYFVVAEGLTNVAKYAGASEAVVEVRQREDEVEVVVADDGRGGAEVGAGSGLRGLSARLAALDGQLAVHSPRGGGTRLEAHIPSQAEARG